MRVVATSDLHGQLPRTPPCDVLLIAGDVCPIFGHEIDRQHRWLTGEFAEWLQEQPAEVIVGIGGNHDFVLEEMLGLGSKLPWTYLQDEAVRLDHHIIHGAPWTPPFMTWAFMLPEEQLAKRWKLIPPDTTILMTHGPAYGRGDRTARTRENVGSITLGHRIEQLDGPLRLHVFGHIHEERGRGTLLGHTADWANVSFLDLQYEPHDLPFEVFEL